MGINVLDLFAWAWGLTEWFFKEWYNFVGHVEMDKYACETLKTRILFYYLKNNNLFDEYLQYLEVYNKEKDINKVIEYRNKLITKYNLKNEVNKVYNEEISDDTYSDLLTQIKKSLWNNKLHLLIWWPPCQTYSQIWRARVWAKICKDPRNFLYLQYVKFLKDLQPEIFVFENVVWLKTAWWWKYLEDIKKAITEAWYYIETDYEKVKQYMPDYCIPQNRTRLILIWWKKNSKIINSYPDLDKYKVKYEYKVKDFLWDLPNIQAGWWKKIMKYKKENKLLIDFWIRNNKIDFAIDHYTRPIRNLDKEIYKIAVDFYKEWKKLKYVDLPDSLQTHKNKSIFLNRFNVINWDWKITSTIVAHLSSDGHYYIHYDKRQNRSISIREAARLQTFPDDFKFEWSRTSIFKQIWNAVPPIFSRILAKEFKNYFKNQWKKKS